MKIFGRNPNGKHQLNLMNSSNYRNGEFVNLTPTVMLAEDASYSQMVGEFFKKVVGR